MYRPNVLSLSRMFVFFSAGASACVRLKMFGEAITWCDKGLAVSFNNLDIISSQTFFILLLNVEIHLV